MDPYRGAYREDSLAETPRDAGIVGDIISQFADPLAFYRELVQNAIDAGSPQVDIRLAYDEGAGLLHVEVRDRGEGMTRDILENQLLVLFRSTKEKDSSKIGKFGIGFASVLAPNPEVVAVQTARGGRRLALHLHRDLTYQIYDSGPATQTGTTVELDIAMPLAQISEFVRASIVALERWCRHASVPITFAVHASGEPTDVRRIDRPLGLDDVLVEVRGTADDGKLVCVVGLRASASAYAGFFNHGLMLHETVEPLVGNVAVKLQDERLGHTLSRDDVRRDAHFERALVFARGLVEHELASAVGTALGAAASSGDHARWWQLALALTHAKLELPRGAWSFPLVEPSQERRAIGSIGRRAWCAQESSPLTTLLGEPVLLAPSDRESFRALVESVTGCTLRDVEGELTAITPIVPATGDEVLAARLAELLAAVHRAPEIVVAKLDGVHGDALAVTGEPDSDGAYVVDRDAAARNPFGRKRLALVLSERHPLYRAARAADPRAGASLLARILLLSHNLLDVPRSTLLVERMLEDLA